MPTLTDQPLISVVLATYNGARYLPVQLDAVFAQTYPNMELVAVDDASTDHTFAVLSEYAARYPQMRVYRNEQNLGYIKNFERACGLATGDLIALCDQDDYWLPEKLERMYAAIGNKPMVYCDSQICNSELQPMPEQASSRAVLGPVFSCLQQAVVCRIYGHASLMRRTLFEAARPFPDALPHDWWLSYTASLHGGIAYLPEVLVHYRQHPQSAVGAVGERSRHRGHPTVVHRKFSEMKAIRRRMQLFYEACPPALAYEKGVLRQLSLSYNSFAPHYNLQRVRIFLRHQAQLLSGKKGTPLRKYVFCLKMLYRIR